MFRTVAVLTALFLLVPLAVVADHIPCEVTKLTASDGATEDFFGSSVAIHGDYAFVGALRDDDAGDGSGSVYVFRRSNNIWIEDSKLTASDGAEWDFFGHSVSISGDYAVIGAPYEDWAGAAYVFHRSGTVWSEQAKLTASDAEAGDWFGFDVSIHGEYAVVGARFDTGAGNESGSAYVFHRDGSTWTEEAKLTASDASSDDQFGSSVSINGDYAAIGAIWSDGAAPNSGSVYIFKRDGVVWLEEEKIFLVDGAYDDRFGPVSIDGDCVVIGAAGDDDAGDGAGAVYVFRRYGTSWTEEEKLTAGDGEEWDLFGIEVDLDGDTAIIGALRDDDNGDSSGSAYLFKCNGTTWTEEAKITASDSATEDFFGWSVELSNSTVIVGAERDDDAGDSSGSAYIFGLDYTACGTAATDLTCVPPAGTVPFSVHITAGMTNNYPDQVRRFACHTDVQLAGGNWFPNWRAGFTNVGAGQTFSSSWVQTIPALGSVIGDNVFTLVAEDVTPSPYNQPPYPPSGDTDTATCTVTGIAP